MIPETINENTLNKLVSKMHEKNRKACLLMYYAGLRVSEVCKLKKRDIDLKSGTIFISRSKNLKNRYVLIDDKLIPHLLELMKGKKDDDVLIKTKPALLWFNIKYQSKKYGIRVHPHTLRHSYATNLLNDGFPITDVKELLGHSDVSTTQVYLHTSLTHIKDRWNTLKGGKKP